MRDAYDDFVRHDRERQRWLDSRPLCRACGEPIQEDTCLGLHGHKYHWDCIAGWADDAAPEYMEATI